MTLPPGTPEFSLKAKEFLTSYRVCKDVQNAIEHLKADTPTFGGWRIQWSGICSLLKSSMVVTQLDAKRCYSAELRASLKEGWHRLRRNKAEYPLYWDMIDRERNNILKEYEFSAYDSYIKEDGTVTPLVSLFDLATSKHELRIKSGVFKGRLALELADEAAEWVEGYIVQLVREGGYDPEEEHRWGTFLRP